LVELFRGVYSVTMTKRRRFLWCAWWTAEPRAEPFRPPDAWSGGARSLETAKSAAEQAAGTPLSALDGRWAGAWVRVRAGLPPFVEHVAPSVPVAKPAHDPHALLGVAPGASLIQIKSAFRKQALEHHPDRGGDPLKFMAAKAAFDALARRRERKRRRKR